jgi:hypothetical protein
MPCDRIFKRNQTIKVRQAEINTVVNDVNSLIAAGKIKPKVDKKTGAIAFEGLSDGQRDDVSDACIYRRLMVTGSSLAKAKIAQAEMLAGRTVNKAALAQGIHSHDGGSTWHNGH